MSLCTLRCQQISEVCFVVVCLGFFLKYSSFPVSGFPRAMVSIALLESSYSKLSLRQKVAFVVVFNVFLLGNFIRVYNASWSCLPPIILFSFLFPLNPFF